MKTATLKITKPTHYKRTEDKKNIVYYVVSGNSEAMELYKQDQIADLGRISTDDDGNIRFNKSLANAYRYGIENTIHRAFDEEENKYYWYVDTKADDLLLAGLDPENDPIGFQMVQDLFLKRRVATAAAIAKNTQEHTSKYIAKLKSPSNVEPNPDDIAGL